jgi:hypothetical protein
MDKNGKKGPFVVDHAFRFIWRGLCEDALAETNLSRYTRNTVSRIYEALLPWKAATLRDTLSGIRDPWAFPKRDVKWVRQLRDFGKRFIFADEGQDLVERSYATFKEVQRELASGFLPNRATIHVLGRARTICADVLRDFCVDEQVAFGRFARNAVVGHQYRNRRLDRKLNGLITGSRAHIDFLHDVLRSDHHLARALKNAEECVSDVLSLSFVPKSFKALRSIMPDTLAGSFYNSGMGEVIKYRLKQFTGMDLDTAQERHRRVARMASLDFTRDARNRLATVDMSQASDRVSLDLLAWILPPQWFKVIMHGQIRRYQWCGENHAIESAATMGLGHTFALETLVHYALTRATCEGLRASRRHFVIVYGDDIICPSWVIPYLVEVFRNCHMKLNEDKSYWGLSDFRESCGADWFRGYDVRPVMPEWVAGADVTRDELADFVIKTANVLLTHWSPFDIPRTLDRMFKIIHCLDRDVLFVPPHFPDSSGIKTSDKTLWNTTASTYKGKPTWLISTKCWDWVDGYTRCENEDAILWEAMRARFVSYLTEQRRCVEFSTPMLTMRRHKVRGKVRWKACLIDPNADKRRIQCQRPVPVGSDTVFSVARPGC